MEKINKAPKAGNFRSFWEFPGKELFLLTNQNIFSIQCSGSNLVLFVLALEKSHESC